MESFVECKGHARVVPVPRSIVKMASFVRFEDKQVIIAAQAWVERGCHDCVLALPRVATPASKKATFFAEIAKPRRRV